MTLRAAGPKPAPRSAARARSASIDDAIRECRVRDRGKGFRLFELALGALQLASAWARARSALLIN